MQVKYGWLLATAILVQTLCAQTSLLIDTRHSTPADFNYLLQPNHAIATNDTIHEWITDLAEPALLDSMIEKRKQHHKVFLVGWMIHAFGGYNWRAVDMHKQKFVGTVVRNSKSSTEEYTEYDINFDINFHLKKYLNKIFYAYDLQKKIGRQDIRKSHHRNYDSIPFVRDTSLIDIRNYRLHCELTPPRAFRPQLNYLFYPTLPETKSLAQHPNFETNHPTMGFYGTYCLDCNHSCHPELHPYEWVWWLKANKNDFSNTKTWLIGLMHESSNRMKNWSQNPMAGSIKIPFAFKCDNEAGTSFVIKAEHLVFDRFVESNSSLLPITETSYSAKEDRSFTVNGFEHINIEVNFSTALTTESLRYAFNHINYDEQKQVLSGYFHLAMSVENLYTARVTFETKE